MNPANQYTKTRIAPTPSGFLHLGNVLSFAITAGLAQQCNAGLLLRIDDLDRERVKDIYVQDIFDTLGFLDIPYDEGPLNITDYENDWSQMHRMHLYQKALEQLADTGKVFACTCSRTQADTCSCQTKAIPLDTADANWRLCTDEAAVSIKTFTGIIESQLPPHMQNFVVKKKDGFPAYQLTSLVDDLHYGIDLIVRGNDLWASSIAQHYLAMKLGADEFNNITFYHHELLTGANGDKLSKSAGDTSVNYLRGQGKKPADVYMLIAGLLGINLPISNWQELADAGLKHHPVKP